MFITGTDLFVLHGSSNSEGRSAINARIPFQISEVWWSLVFHHHAFCKLQQVEMNLVCVDLMTSWTCSLLVQSLWSWSSTFTMDRKRVSSSCRSLQGTAYWHKSYSVFCEVANLVSICSMHHPLLFLFLHNLALCIQLLQSGHRDSIAG